MKLRDTIHDSESQRLGQRVAKLTGRRWCERIWTVIATYAQQGRSVFTFILTRYMAHFSGGSPALAPWPSGP